MNMFDTKLGARLVFIFCCIVAILAILAAVGRIVG